MLAALKCGLADGSGTAKQLCKILPKKSVLKYQVATLKRVSFMTEDELPIIKPFPYNRKYYNVFDMLTDCRTRDNENAKLIVIDGPVASGKHKLAQYIAKEFEMLYLPQPTIPDLYRTYWGYDLRQLDAKVPVDAQTFDIERYLQNPNHVNTAFMQQLMLFIRVKRYIQALLHLFATGQGVVTVRSPWVDSVFSRTMANHGHVSRKAFVYQKMIASETLCHLFHPHLIIYLDVPVDTTLEKIKQRGRPEEMNSKVLTKEYLQMIEDNYKFDYLPKMAVQSLVLLYDWAEEGDMDYIIDDLEKADFEYVEPRDQSKFSSWRNVKVWDWRSCTYRFSNCCNEILLNLFNMRTDIPELIVTGEDQEDYEDEYEKIKDFFYDVGYNPKKGDTSFTWKTDLYLWEDNVTPLMEKYYERKAKAKQRKAASG